MKDTCAIVLAAGDSTRMRAPKQLLFWEDKTLLEYQIERLAALPLKEIVVILGHESEKLRRQVTNIKSNVTFLNCNNYEEGLSASLKCGLSYSSKSFRHILIMLLDLPLIQLQTIESVLEKGTSLTRYERIPFSVQTTYLGKKGHPVFIGNFRELDWGSVQGDTGAKLLLKQMKTKEYITTNDIGTIFDIDTPEDYEKALKLREKYKEVNKIESIRFTNSL